MKLIDNLRAQLESIGATLDEGIGDYVMHADAPSGYTWRANGCRTICIQWASNSQTWLAKAIKDAMKDLRLGLEKETDPESIAAARWDTGDDAWGAAADAPEHIEWPGGGK